MNDYEFIPELDDKNHPIMDVINLVQITQKLDDKSHPIIELYYIFS